MADKHQGSLVSKKKAKWAPFGGPCQGMPVRKHTRNSGVSPRGILGDSERKFYSFLPSGWEIVVKGTKPEDLSLISAKYVVGLPQVTF